MRWMTDILLFQYYAYLLTLAGDMKRGRRMTAQTSSDT